MGFRAIRATRCGTHGRSADKSGSSTDSRIPGALTERPISYILLQRENEGEATGTTLGERTGREDDGNTLTPCGAERSHSGGDGGGSVSEISRRRAIANQDGEGLSIQVQELNPMVWNRDSTDDEYEEGTQIPRQQQRPPESRRGPDYLDGPPTTSGGELRVCLACQTWTYGLPCHTPTLTSSSTGSSNLSRFHYHSA